MEKLYDLKDITSLADTAEASMPGIQMAVTLTVRGDFDDTATTGVHAVFSGIVGGTTSRTVTIVLDGTNQYSFEAFCTAYRNIVRNKEIVGYEAVLVSTGAVTIS